MSSRPLPPALEPYLRLPPETSLILLTSTLGCSVNWLTARHMSSALTADNSETSPEEEQTAVLLVSWMRDAAFWKMELKRGGGLDTSRLTTTSRFAFLDFFSNPSSTTLQETQTAITSTISKILSAGTRKIILILDNPDILLATSSTATQSLNTFLLTLRSQVHATILTCCADLPFVSAAAPGAETQPTPIEAETAAFVATQAHAARLVMSVRELETGAARDVSGVLRVTRGGGWYDEGLDLQGKGGKGGREEVKEAELLYLVQRDGNVKVFTRGSEAT